MTGYGKAVLTYGEKKINVEVKSLNSKTMDLSTRIAPLYREKEMEIRQMLTRKLVRGKVDFSIWIEKDEVADAATINAALVDNYYHQIRDIAAKTGIPEPTDPTDPTEPTEPENPEEGITNTRAEAGAYKVFRDGQLLIIRDGHAYNMQGIRIE